MVSHVLRFILISFLQSLDVTPVITKKGYWSGVSMSAAETIQILRVRSSPFWPSLQALSRYPRFLFEKNLNDGLDSLDSLLQNDLCFYKDNLGTRPGTKEPWNNADGRRFFYFEPSWHPWILWSISQGQGQPLRPSKLGFLGLQCRKKDQSRDMTR